MSSIREFLSARDEYITRVKEELLGPGSEISIPDSEHELITNSPDVRYSIGILFPKNNKLNADSNDSSRVEEESGELPEDPSDEDEGTEGDGKEKPDPVAPAEEENLDEEISLAAQNMPSSLGFTFLVSSDPQLLKCEVIFATYRRATMPDCRIPFSPDCPEKYAVPPQLSSYVVYDNEEKCLKLRTGLNRKTVRDLHEQDFLDGDEYGIFPAMYKLCDQLKGGYVRVPHNADVVIDFSSGDYVDNNKRLDETSAKITALKRKINENLYSVTVMLVNDDEEKSNGTRCLFQPTVKIKSDVNGFRFCEYSSLVDFNLLDAEEQSLELQYRNKRVYGTGLGTSVNWNIDADGNGEIYNDFFPETEVPSMDFSIPQGLGIHKEALSMRHLSDLDQTEKSQKLSELKSVADAYSGWIDTLKEKQQELSACYKAAAESNIAGCLKARNRMLAGLKVLNDDSVAWTAFSLANRAMFMQRVHLKLQSDMADIDRYPGDEDLTKLLETLDYGEPRSITGDNYAWRLFQIAFLLMSIESVTNDTACDRDVVDLIWFPTGGGKTEAYLGLTAFTIFYRRLAHLPDSDGTTVIMRYTLRLLAAQQFTRASTLICACEYIRSDAVSRHPKYGKYPLGNTEITIGLWIGREHIPNTYPKVLQRGSSSVYFPITVSSLVIPPYSSLITKKIEDSAAFADCKNIIAGYKRNVPKELLPMLIQSTIRDYAKKIAIEKGITTEKVQPILERKWIVPTGEDEYLTTSVKYRAEEYEALSGEVSMSTDDYGDFLREGTEISNYAIPFIKSISLIHKVREVQALVGFSRLKPVDANMGESSSEYVVPVKQQDTNWYPAYEVRGEGIFIEFDENAISEWQKDNPEIQHRVDVLNENYRKSFIGQSKPRKVTAKFLLLHTISHTLIKQLSFECGYSIASLKERLYCSEISEGKQMSGIFIYTASGDSEGTMGGLVRQGCADTFPGIFKKAMEEAMTCSNDPVCSLSMGQGRDSLNLSACYSCCLIPETSCEEFNIFLDRGTIVGTYENREMGFYSRQLYGTASWKDNSISKVTTDVSLKSSVHVIVTDYGTDLRDSVYAEIWNSLRTWAVDTKEKVLLSELESNSDLFSQKEKPYRDCMFQVGGNEEMQKCDLFWKESQVALFTSDNEECYAAAKNSDIRCIYCADDTVTVRKILDVLKEQ